VAHAAHGACTWAVHAQPGALPLTLKTADDLDAQIQNWTNGILGSRNCMLAPPQPATHSTAAWQGWRMHGVLEPWRLLEVEPLVDANCLAGVADARRARTLAPAGSRTVG